MSWSVTLRTLIKDLDCFKEACDLNNISFNWDTLKLYGKNNVYLGKLIEDKKDDEEGSVFSLQSDSDFVGKNRRSSDQCDINTLMQSYSEVVCRRRIGSVGTILERTEDERGILLKVSVG
jgi:hypothetical protein